MDPNIKFYSAFLMDEKWISKTDFIYRVKVNCDCAGETHSRFLRFLYQLDFRRVKRSVSGGIVFY